MLSQAVLDLLKMYLGKEGGYTETLLTYPDPEIDLGTKILYLQRAVLQERRIFLRSLDLLCNRSATNLELLRALLAINDICHNNEIEYYGRKTAHRHFFGAVDPDIKTKAVEVCNEARETIRSIIAELQKEDVEMVCLQTEARKMREVDIVKRESWRALLGFPEEDRIETSATGSFFDQRRKSVYKGKPKGEESQLHRLLRTLPIIGIPTFRFY
ncbi:MAG: hypothetical protein A3E87_06410 [Gammaproteobacteria bacterium RIFCSPHIGHO2_12_FULL_35_23]|nr:MAG: hypothetical protein A3E87_06410 [Gammaproteobacteria bacterium RIFCSPHIGHO2_12_FULL_35_23]